MKHVDIVYLRDSRELYGKEGIVPTTHLSAGMDLRACMEEEYIDIPAGERHPFGCGIALNISRANTETIRLAGFIYSRSGLGAKEGLCVAQGVGVIDSDYRGELIAYLLNTSSRTLRVERGDRIAQLLFQNYFPFELHEVHTLPTSERGTEGFGHSGVK